jgi:hypothetical protein
VNSKLVRFHCIWSSYQLGISCPDLRSFGENLGIDPWIGQNYFHYIPPDSSCNLAIAYSERHEIDSWYQHTPHCVCYFHVRCIWMWRSVKKFRFVVPQWTILKWCGHLPTMWRQIQGVCSLVNIFFTSSS